jgi:hypothetical protein
VVRCDRDHGVDEGLAGAAGINDLDFDDKGRLPRETIDDLQTRMSPMLGDVAQIARAVEYVVTQPIDVNIEELVNLVRLPPSPRAFRTNRSQHVNHLPRQHRQHRQHRRWVEVGHRKRNKGPLVSQETLIPIGGGGRI